MLRIWEGAQISKKNEISSQAGTAKAMLKPSLRKKERPGETKEARRVPPPGEGEEKVEKENPKFAAWSFVA